MPLNPSALAVGFLTPNLFSVAHIGIGTPKLALGIAMGVCQFLTSQAKAITVDVGTFGVGTSIMPLVVPPPLLQGGLYTGFSSMGIIGVFSPLTITGVTNGLVTGLTALALLQTNHPSVGVGSGIARIVGPSAVPAMLQGFSSMGMTGVGSIKLATAIGMALDITFAGFTLPIPIVGPASPVAGAGSGFGKIS